MKIILRTLRQRFVQLWLFCFLPLALGATQPPVIPLPASYSLGEGCFGLQKPIGVLGPDSDKGALTQMVVNLFAESGYHAFATDGRILGGQTLRLSYLTEFDSLIGNEGYHLHIGSSEIRILANSNAGLQYAINTLGQLLRAAANDCLSAWSITDYPRFSYRGMHLDVSRHFMPVAFIFRYLDLLAMHRMNTFHWHLVDDQGWRLQIDRYPLLTEVGAWREDRSHEHWNHRPLSSPEAPKTYGGFYTKDEVRQVVAYAQARNITVIPEIEMPAHVMSALAAYPGLSCTGKNLGVPPGGVWPITHIYCAGKEETFEFLENVLLEVMELFPSPLIHIGGDEADKTEWKSCELCQARMAAENLPDVHALQSYFIRRIGAFLASHGRRLMGWDEILEGGLAENAIVMSWRGEEGGIQAARMQHHVVMTPGSHCYFDHYQGDPSTEPLAIGGFTPLDKVYAYEPEPAELTPEEKTYIIGAQANVWTEYMPVPAHVEYMVLPRMAALSEVLWSPAQSRNWESFVRRLPHLIRNYEAHGYNYARSAWKVQATEEVLPEARQIKVSLTTLLPVDSIVFRTEGKGSGNSPQVYRNPLMIGQSTKLQAYAVVNGTSTPVVERNYHIHKAFGLQVEQQPTPSKRYPGTAYSLTDGIEGSRWFADGRWSGILDDHWQASLSFGKATRVKQIGLTALHDPASWIFLPDSLVVYVSKNGRTFRPAGHLKSVPSTNTNEVSTHRFVLYPAPGRYKAIRIGAFRTADIPATHPGHGEKVWMFFSEITAD
ncbi:MAG: family 20 glycosylhydrolase [Bacteroidetes bacterium]|nr:family 20 glycosylhydrolase [Bacteroidota bacterium]